MKLCFTAALPVALLPMLLVASLSSAALAQVAGQVVGVADGDTIRVASGGKTLTVRLACVDSPETAQEPFGLGPAATQRLKQLLPSGQVVTLRVVDTDQYGRTVAEVYRGNLSISLAMVQEGQAVIYRQYLSGCPNSRDRLLKAEATAKQQRIGFWNQAEPTLPWDFRQGGRSNPKPIARSSTSSQPTSVKANYNCSDFETQAEAQKVLNASPGDPHQLDRDKDGAACESLP